MSVKQEVVLSETVARLVQSQVASGRYADVSAAVQDAAFNYFIGSPTIFDEYKVTPDEVERAYKREIEKARVARKKGTLKAWK